MSEVSAVWLDRVVLARTTWMQTRFSLGKLEKLLHAGDMDRSEYNDDADLILTRDGTRWRHLALQGRLGQLEHDLAAAEVSGSTVGPILLGLREIDEALNETILNTEALLADVPGREDPFIDRLEEHPAYERD